jgi:5,10-methenyltetrahydromethanopterin hydrogenase
MEDFYLVQFIQKIIKERKRQVLDLLENNGINSMEQYASLMGELNSLNYIQQELSDLLEKQEHMHD